MVELVAVVLEGGQKVFAECQCMIKVRKDDDFLVFFGHDSLDYSRCSKPSAPGLDTQLE